MPPACCQAAARTAMQQEEAQQTESEFVTKIQEENVDWVE